MILKDLRIGKSMEPMRLEETYETLQKRKIHWKSMSPSKQRCIKSAVAYYNENLGHLPFIDWMIRQPEIMKYFPNGLRIIRAGKQSAFYEICCDLLFRITRAEGITREPQNTPLQ